MREVMVFRLSRSVINKDRSPQSHRAHGVGQLQQGIICNAEKVLLDALRFISFFLSVISVSLW
jgi:hypothetical protein